MNNENTVKSTDPLSDDFCWFEFLNQPIRDFSVEDLSNARGLATSWVTCACGQMCKDLPRFVGSTAPMDMELNSLGLEFMTCIEDAYDAYGRWADEFPKLIHKAKKTLIKIEKRTNVLLKSKEIVQ
jgi:hypothetical protein